MSRYNTSMSEPEAKPEGDRAELVDILSSRVLLRPTDPARSHHFYGTTLGLAIYREFEGGVVYFLGGGFLEVAGRSETPPSPALKLWLQVADVTAAHEELLAAGVEVRRPPVREPWGLIEMWIADPDGTEIVLVEIPADHPLRYRPGI